ncbi:MAG: hypothetical protein HRT36_07335, partial [Alphaproteobacteria bacterium]|nr:hypothetical protein [Alphaproteobacteria bacterium]
FAHPPLSRQTTVRIAPVAVIRQQVTPWRTDTHDPENRVDKLPIVSDYAAPTARATQRGAVPAIPILFSLICRVCDVMLPVSGDILTVCKNLLFLIS